MLCQSAARKRWNLSFESESKPQRTSWFFHDKSNPNTFSILQDIRYVTSQASDDSILSLQRRKKRLRSTANHILLTHISFCKTDILNARTDADLAINQFISLPYGKKRKYGQHYST
uniref:Uncharacterized protein n=1 Tax=Glossina palpalis gambiensis TaxID=67801 RepID=A0A1B0B883_9MUSC